MPESVPTLRALDVKFTRGEFGIECSRFDAVEGSIHAILGASGSGKSTLVRILMRLEPHAKGQFLHQGITIPASGRAHLAHLRRCGLVQQKPGLLRTTLIENVAYPLRVRGTAKAEAHRRALAALARVDLENVADAHAENVSGGEAQRAALARALVSHPDILFLDEATNQLDPKRVRLVEEILREERDRGACIILVTHSIAQARRLARDVTFLDDGQVVYQGATGELNLAQDVRVQDFLKFA